MTCIARWWTACEGTEPTSPTRGCRPTNCCQGGPQKVARGERKKRPKWAHISCPIWARWTPPIKGKIEGGAKCEPISVSQCELILVTFLVPRCPYFPDGHGHFGAHFAGHGSGKSSSSSRLPAHREGHTPGPENVPMGITSPTNTARQQPAKLEGRSATGRPRSLTRQDPAHVEIRHGQSASSVRHLCRRGLLTKIANANAEPRVTRLL